MILTFNIQTAKASGTIYIRADGSIDGPANITTVGYVTYTFNESNYDEIVVERSNIIIDGNGSTLQGNGSGYGFTLFDVNNVTLVNTNITNFSQGILICGGAVHLGVGNHLVFSNKMLHKEGLTMTSSLSMSKMPTKTLFVSSVQL